MDTRRHMPVLVDFSEARDFKKGETFLVKVDLRNMTLYVMAHRRKHHEKGKVRLNSRLLERYGRSVISTDKARLIEDEPTHEMLCDLALRLSELVSKTVTHLDEINRIQMGTYKRVASKEVRIEVRL